MRRVRFAALGTVAVGTVVAVIGVCCYAADRAPSPSETPAVNDQIQRVQNGLLPAAFVKGEPAKAMRLSDRMFVYHVTGVSIAVIHDGAIVWSTGLGASGIGGPPVTANTLFQAGSISKPVTALAALRLVQSGQIDLDADVNRYLKSWKVPANPFTEKRKVTLRELLTHTAGTGVEGFSGYATDQPAPTLAQVLNGTPPANSKPITVDTVPGTRWRYSGGGYTIVQQMLIDVTGEPFPRLLQAEVLSPLGMTHSTFEQPLPTALAAQAATPYLGTGEPVTGGPHIYPEMAAAGLWTTAEDLARFAIAIQDSLANRPGAILPRTLATQMVATELGKRGVMFGVLGSAQDPLFAHSGEDAGFVSYLVAYEKRGEGAVVLTNGDRGFDLAEEIIRAIAQEYAWPDFHPVEHVLAKVPSRQLEKYAGCYRITPGVSLYVSRQADHLSVQTSGGDSWQMVPDSQTHFFSQAADVQLTFQPDNVGRFTKAILNEYGESKAATRTRPCERARWSSP